MRRKDRITLAALVLTAAGCNALSGVNDFQFDRESSGGPGGSGGGGSGGGGSGGAPPVCGDGRVGPGEACDDENTTPEDGCDERCAIEPGYSCAGAPSACALNAPAVVALGPGLGLGIPDDESYTGTLASMLCMTLAVPDQGFARVARVEVTLGLQHTWLSDLVAKVASPQGTVTTLMSRVGINEPNDAVSELNGDGSDLAFSHPITFRDDAAVAAEQMGATIDNAKVVCRDDAICGFVPTPDQGPGTSLADFQGEPPAGDWHVCVADADGTELGALDQVQISVLAW